MLVQIIRNRIAAREQVVVEAGAVVAVHGANHSVALTEDNWHDIEGFDVEYHESEQSLSQVIVAVDAPLRPAFPEGAPPSPKDKQRPAFWLAYYLAWIQNLPPSKFDKVQGVYQTRWPLDQILLLLKGCLVEFQSKEPQIHSLIQPKLPHHHPLAYEDVRCCYSLPKVEKLGEWLANPGGEIELLPCELLLHNGATNECVQPWVESGLGNLCMSCYLYAVQLNNFHVFALKNEL
jgi:hypothetical protein